MRIKEILSETIVNELTRPESKHEAEELLIKHGYQRIGKGWFAIVMHKGENPHILKLFDSRDTAYIKFIEMAMTNPNTHFPKIKGKIIKVTGKYYAIRMEKLTPYPVGAPVEDLGIGQNFDVVELADTLDGYLKISEMMKNYNIDEKELTDYQRQVIWQINQYEKTQPGLLDALNLMSSVSGVKPDLHRDNLMFRGNTIVITDPVYDPKTM